MINYCASTQVIISLVYIQIRSNHYNREQPDPLIQQDVSLRASELLLFTTRIGLVS